MEPDQTKAKKRGLLMCRTVHLKLGCLRIEDKVFGLNRKEPKFNLFGLFFGLFHETNFGLFQFVSFISV